MNRPDDLDQLAKVSQQVGTDPLLVQAAGGNTSVKDGNTMWIKASGTMLADALAKDIFVPCDLAKMRKVLAESVEAADKTEDFVIGEHPLRPSIETSLHAVFAQRVVLHVHCVNTIAIAIRKDARQILEDALADFDWGLVPYVQPGARLATLVEKELGEKTDVMILGNHGLIVAAQSVADAMDLLDRVVAKLAAKLGPPAAAGQPRIEQLEQLANEHWEVPDADDRSHQLALDKDRIAKATAGSLYPDHVIFCGPGAVAISDGQLPDMADAPPFVIVPEQGILIKADASDGAKALILCLADVLLRVPAEAQLNYFNDEDNQTLLGWDAEKYRQRMNA